jgi:hypothetical protein
MALQDARPDDSFFGVSRESSCHRFTITGCISEATHLASTRSCRGLAGSFLAVRSTSPRYVCNSCKVRTCLTATSVRLLFHSFLKRGTPLKAEYNATLDRLSENGSCHAPACPALPSTCHPSSYRPGHLASASTGRDPWTTTLAAIHQFFSAPDRCAIVRNYPGGSARIASRSVRKKTDGGDVRTFTVTVVEELSNPLLA